MTTYTEAEAATKWCPYSRVVPDAKDYSAGNRFLEDGTRTAQEMNELARCIGSRCMAWQWSKLNPDKIKPEHRKGYCTANASVDRYAP